MSQNPTTIVARVKPAEVDALSTILATINGNPTDNQYILLNRIRGLHFACLILLNRDPQYPPSLVLEANHDGASDEFLEDLILQSGAGLAAIYSHCEGLTDVSDIGNYLRTHRHPTAAYYIGCRAQSVASVLNAMATRSQIEAWLDGQDIAHKLRGMSADSIYDSILSDVQSNPPQPAYTPNGSFADLVSRANLNILLWVLVAIILLAPLLVFLVFYIPVLRMHEIRDLQGPQATPPGIDPRLFEAEDITTQNHLTTLVDVKPGRFRLNTLKAVLWLVNGLAETVFIAGSLGGISTIHFARWLLIDDDRRLLFFSNYDGSWASYLGDFVDRANYGLTAIWGNTVGFPPSEFLFLGGAKYIEAFKLWSRRHNEYANVWYSAYSDATVSNIIDAVRLRDGLRRKPAGAAALTRWLRSL